MTWKSRNTPRPCRATINTASLILRYHNFYKNMCINALPKQNAPFIILRMNGGNTPTFLFTTACCPIFQTRETDNSQWHEIPSPSNNIYLEGNAKNAANKPSNGVKQVADRSSALRGPRSFPSQIRRSSRAGAKCTNNSAASSGIQAKQWRLRIGATVPLRGHGKMSPWESPGWQGKPPSIPLP